MSAFTIRRVVASRYVGAIAPESVVGSTRRDPHVWTIRRRCLTRRGGVLTSGLRRGPTRLQNRSIGGSRLEADAASFPLLAAGEAEVESRCRPTNTNEKLHPAGTATVGYGW